MLYPPRWACLRSCLPPCLPSGLGCCVRLAGLVFLLSAVLSPYCLPSWLGGLSPVLSPSLFPIWSGMLCPPPWSCLSLVSGLVSQLLSLFCLVACLSSGMLCLPPLGLSFSCLWSCLPACLPSGLGCCVRLLGSSPSPACLRSFVPSCFPAGLVCPCSGLVSKISCAICATVRCLRWCNFLYLFISIFRNRCKSFLLLPTCISLFLHLYSFNFQQISMHICAWATSCGASALRF